MMVSTIHLSALVLATLARSSLALSITSVQPATAPDAGDEQNSFIEVRTGSEDASPDKSAALAETVRHPEAKAALRRPHLKSHKAKRRKAHETDTNASATIEEEANEGAEKVNQTYAQVVHPPAPKCADCIVWGGVNILSFNAHRARAVAEPNQGVELTVRQNTLDQFCVPEDGTYWLVNNDKVQIQGRYWRCTPSRLGLGLGAIAIGGPMLGNNTLIVRAQSGSVTWNGKDILDHLSSVFSNKFVTAHYIASVRSVAGEVHAPGIKFIFANSVRLTVARYRDKLSARITLCDTDLGAVQLGGHCGDLQETPSRSVQEWLAMQAAVEKLSKFNNLFETEYTQQ